MVQAILLMLGDDFHEATRPGLLDSPDWWLTHHYRTSIHVLMTALARKSKAQRSEGIYHAQIWYHQFAGFPVVISIISDVAWCRDVILQNGILCWIIKTPMKWPCCWGVAPIFRQTLGFPILSAHICPRTSLHPQGCIHGQNEFRACFPTRWAEDLTLPRWGIVEFILRSFSHRSSRSFDEFWYASFTWAFWDLPNLTRFLPDFYHCFRSTQSTRLGSGSYLALSGNWVPVPNHPNGTKCQEATS